jgi:hypothetical protein
MWAGFRPAVAGTGQNPGCPIGGGEAGPTRVAFGPVVVRRQRVACWPGNGPADGDERVMQGTGWR